MNRVAIITQARMTSTRLPAKVMKKILSIPLLEYHISRLRQSGLPIIVATTANKEDEPIIEYCIHSNIPFFRGNEQNVLERYYLAALENKLDHIIRVTSDCPLIDGKLIAQGYQTFLNEKNITKTYLSNCRVRTYPRGFDFEIFSFASLKVSHENAVEPFEREHVTPYIWQTNPNAFLIKHFLNKQDRSIYRLTVDEIDDFNLIQNLIINHNAHLHSCHEIIKIMDDNPDLFLINKHVEQKKI